MAMSDGCSQFMKYLFGFINLLLFIFGIAVLAISILAVTGDGYKAEKLADGNLFKIVAYSSIAISSVITLVSFMGCCGAFMESRVLLHLFFVFTLLLFLLCGACVIASFVVSSEKSLNKLEKRMYDSLGKYETDRKVRDGWDILQKSGHCCGAQSGRDYYSMNMKFPSSCCKLDKKDKPMACTKSPTSSDSYTEVGCVKKTRELIKSNGRLVGGVAIAVLVFQFISMVLSCAISHSIYD